VNPRIISIHVTGDVSFVLFKSIRKVYKFNNLTTFNGKSKEVGELLIQGVEVLSLIIDRRPKERLKQKADK